MKFPLLGAFEPPHETKKILGPLQRISNEMQRFRDSEPVDYCVVGVGSAGGVLLQRLSKAGFKVVGLEAGPFWDTERDWVSDEKGSHKLYWNDLRMESTTALIDRLKKIAVLTPQPEVQIRGDGAARYEGVGRIIYACQRAGIAKVGFITEPPPRGG